MKSIIYGILVQNIYQNTYYTRVASLQKKVFRYLEHQNDVSISAQYQFKPSQCQLNSRIISDGLSQRKTRTYEELFLS